jgi:hypothetical protein
MPRRDGFRSSVDNWRLGAMRAQGAFAAVPIGRRRLQPDYQELTSDPGRHHYEGHNWRGFHHPASLFIAAYSFLIRERLRNKETLFDSKSLPCPTGFHRHRSGAIATARSYLDRHHRVPPRLIHRLRTRCAPVATN